MLIAQVLVLLQSAIDNAFQFGRKIGIQPQRRRGRTFQDSVEYGGGRVAPEWQCSCCHLVQNSSKREKVRATVQFLPFRLLRRHIRHRSQCSSRTREVLLTHSRCCFRCRSSAFCYSARHCRYFCESKLQSLGLAPPGHENICGLDISVNDSLGVCRIEGIGYLNGEREDQFSIHRPPSDTMLKRDAIQKLHSDV